MTTLVEADTRSRFGQRSLFPGNHVTGLPKKRAPLNETVGPGKGCYQRRPRTTFVFKRS